MVRTSSCALVLAVGATLAAGACRKDTSIGHAPALVRVDSSGSGTSSSFSYDEKGRLLEIQTQPLSGEWPPPARFAFVYDRAGRLETVSEFTGQGGVWKPRERVVTAYDAQGRRELVVTSVFSDGGWEPAERMEHAYDEQGRLRELTTVEYPDERAVSRLSWVRDDRGRPLFVTRYEEDGGIWDDRERRVVSWDESGRIAAIVTLDRSSGSWLEKERLTYLYDDAGRLSLETRAEKGEKGQWNPASRITFTYAEGGRLAERVYELLEDEGWTLGGRTTYEHTLQGRSSSFESMGAIELPGIVLEPMKAYGQVRLYEGS